MFNQLSFALILFMLMSIQTFCKPLESTDEQLNDIEKDLASVLSNKQKQDSDEDKIPSSLLKELDESQESEKSADEDKIPQSLLDDLKSSTKSGQQPSSFDKSVLQGFVPATNDESDTKLTDDLLSDEEIMQKQKRLFEILTEKESEDNSKFPKDISSEELEDDNKIPDDLLKDLEESRRELPKQPENTWLESFENNDVKKEILTAVVEDEIVRKINEKVKRGERIPDKVIDLLRKYNAKRSY